MANIRQIRFEELDDLLRLYRQLHMDDPAIEEDSHLKSLWNEICQDENLFYIVAEEDGKLVSSCTLAIIKNLTRGLRPYGVIENVITDGEYRKRGLATQVLHKAVDIAREKNCYKVMLLTSAKDEATLGFYDQAGLQRGIKTGYVLYL